MENFKSSRLKSLCQCVCVCVWERMCVCVCVCVVCVQPKKRFKRKKETEMENQEVSKVSVDLLWTSISPPEVERDKMCMCVCVCVWVCVWKRESVCDRKSFGSKHCVLCHVNINRSHFKEQKLFMKLFRYCKNAYNLCTRTIITLLFYNRCGFVSTLFLLSIVGNSSLTHVKAV